jgi:hypothetical protein
MTKLYRYTVLPIMIASFVWVVFGDLVNLHMKLIYKFDVNANKSLYVKSFNKHKDNENYSLVKALNNSNGFIDDNSEFNTYLSATEFNYNELLAPLNPVTSHTNIGLRAPPIFL